MWLVAPEPIKMEIVMALVHTLSPFYLTQTSFHSSSRGAAPPRWPVTLRSCAGCTR